jgi:hypothetical protein
LPVRTGFCALGSAVALVEAGAFSTSAVSAADGASDGVDETRSSACFSAAAFSSEILLLRFVVVLDFGFRFTTTRTFFLSPAVEESVPCAPDATLSDFFLMSVAFGFCLSSSDIPLLRHNLIDYSRPL